MTLPAPTTTRGYREALAELLRSRFDANVDRVAAAYRADLLFAPADPDRDDLARKLAKTAVLALMRVSP